MSDPKRAPTKATRIEDVGGVFTVGDLKRLLSDVPDSLPVEVGFTDRLEDDRRATQFCSPNWMREYDNAFHIRVYGRKEMEAQKQGGS